MDSLGNFAFLPLKQRGFTTENVDYESNISSYKTKSRINRVVFVRFFKP
jgi:hypothetical protein